MVQFFSNLLEFYDFFCTGLANCKDVSVDITKHFFLCIIAFSSYKPSFAKLSLSPNEAGLSKPTATANCQTPEHQKANF